MDRISSRHNPIVKRFRELARAGADQQWMLLDGEHLVAEALASGVPLDLVAIAEPVASARAGDLAARLTQAGVKTLVVTEGVLAAISPVQHPSGVVGIARRLPVSLDRVFERSPQLVVLIADVQDPGNLGAIVRTAEAFGATGVVASRGSADPFGWKALRGAMGGTFRLPVARHDLGEIADRARRDGIRLVAAVPRGGTDLRRADLRGPRAVLVGGEGAGLAPALVAAADERLTIPMQPPVESFNVAIAAAIILYEALRQRELRPQR